MNPQIPITEHDAQVAFPVLGDAEIAAVEAFGTRLPTQAGDILYQQGDAKYDFYVVLSGEIDVVVDPDVSEGPLARYVAGASSCSRSGVGRSRLLGRRSPESGMVRDPEAPLPSVPCCSTGASLRSSIYLIRIAGSGEELDRRLTRTCLGSPLGALRR